MKMINDCVDYIGDDTIIRLGLKSLNMFPHKMGRQTFYDIINDHDDSTKRWIVREISFVTRLGWVGEFEETKVPLQLSG